MDQGKVLAIRVGSIPRFHRTVQYADMNHVEVGRTSILDDWGIHMSMRGGLLWNGWGRDCVVLQLKKGVLRIGTDDAENLAAFLSRRSIEREN